MEINMIDKISFLILSSIKRIKYPKRTIIQKLIYIYEKEIVEGMFRKNFNDYKSHNYGPFSKNVWEILNMLIANEIIKEIKDINGNSDYNDYKTTNNGDALLIKLENNNIEVDKDYWYNVCEAFKNCDANLITKYVYKIYKDTLKDSLIIDGLIYEKEDYEWIKSTNQNIQEFKKDMKKN